jgi:hypothetical protein
MDGYSKLSALTLRVQEELARRQLFFRLGRFAGNRLIVGTLEEHTARLGFTDDRKHLTYRTESVPHQFSLLVENTSHVQIDIGVAFSGIRAPAYGARLSINTAEPSAVITEESDGRELDPVVFASFLWCAQSLERPWIARSCSDGTRGIRWWAPRIAIGLPLSADLGRGSAFAGLSLPYIPYMSLIGGVNARRVQELASGLRENGPAPVSGEVPTETKLTYGWFFAVGVTEEVFYLLIPKIEAAK